MQKIPPSHDTRDKLWKLLERFRAAMLVTEGQDGALSGRPMSPIVKPEESRIYILAEKQTETVQSLRQAPRALLTFADNKTYVSVSADAVIADDRALIERLWNPGAQAFWPDGPSDPKVCALVLTPHSGEYWDGDNGLAAGIKLLLANLTGAQPDLGDHGEVRL